MGERLIQEKHKQNLIVAVISASVFMFSVDYSMLNINLPTITGYFNATIGSVSRRFLGRYLAPFGRYGNL